MKNTYPKNEKLKSRSQITHLFTQGKSVSKYPIRLVYSEVESLEEASLKIGVSVSKKHFKKAVDRNYFKRLLRESYRNNKEQLVQTIGNKNYVFMLLYQTKEKLTYKEINEKVQAIFMKFNNTIP